MSSTVGPRALNWARLKVLKKGSLGFALLGPTVRRQKFEKLMNYLVDLVSEFDC